jgi:formylmethanofuran dehydrogenase subunit E
MNPKCFICGEEITDRADVYELNDELVCLDCYEEWKINGEEDKE